MYTTINFKTKKELKERVAAGFPVHVFQPGPFPGALHGSITLEGPHYPAAHTWYASAKIEHGIIVRGSVK
jgi:hypothetical protein